MATSSLDLILGERAAPTSTLDLILGERAGAPAAPPTAARQNGDRAQGDIAQRYKAQTETGLHQQIIDEARKRNIDPAQALAMFKQESDFNPSVGNGGLGQFTQETAKSRGLDYNRLNTDTPYNIGASLDYLQDLQKKSGGNIETALEKYNGGGDPNYLANVQQHLPAMQQIVAKHPPPEPGLLSKVGSGIVGSGEAALALGSSIVSWPLVTALEAGRIARQMVSPIDKERKNVYSDIIAGAHKLQEQYSYAPRTETGQAITAVVAAPVTLIDKFGGTVEQWATEAGIDPDKSKLIGEAVRVLGIIDMGIVTHRGIRGSRAALANMRSQFAKSTEAGSPTPELTNAATVLMDRATSDPELQAARAYLTSTLRAVSEQGPPEMTVGEGARQRGQPELPFPPPAQPELPFPPPAQAPTLPTLPEPPGLGTQLEARFPEEGLFAPGNRPGAPLVTEVPTPTPLARARSTMLTAFDSSTPTEVRTAQLADMKAQVREGRPPHEPIRKSLEAFGFTVDEIAQLEQPLRNVRARATLPEEAPVERPVAPATEEVPPTGAQPAAAIPDSTPAIVKPTRPPRPRKVIPETVSEPAAPTPEEPAAPVAPPSPTTTPPAVRYEATSTTAAPDLVTSKVQPATPSPEPQRTALQVRYADAKPDAILYDDTGLNTRTSFEKIRQDVERGRLAPDVAKAMEDNLRRQAETFGVPLEEAHSYAGPELAHQAMRLAQEHDLELYRARRTKTGVEYEQVPREVIDTTLKLETGNPLEPSGVTQEAAATYVADKTRPVGPATLAEIQQALETGTDISASLPEDVQPHFKDMLAQQRQGLNTSEVRQFIDILKDILDVVTPSADPTQLGSLALYGLTDARKAAALRLWGDAQKAGTSFKRVLDQTNMPDSEKILFMRYLASVQKPDLPTGINPRDMKMNAEGTDRILSQRVEIVDGKKIQHAPSYENEIKAIQQTRELPGIQGLTELRIPLKGTYEFGKHDILVPYHALRRMGLLDPVEYAYRGSERAYAQEWATFNKDLDALAAAHNKASRIHMGEYGYSNDEQGMNILIRNGRDLPSLTRNEQVTYEALDNLLQETFFRINEVREATGVGVIEPVEGSYFPYLRVFSNAERLGMQPNWLSTNARDLTAMRRSLGEMQFPREKARTGATYTAEFDAFKLVQDYMQSALKQIHLAPFIEKMRELTQHPLPELDPQTGNPVTAMGEPTWLFSEQKPKANEFLVRWLNYLEHGPQPTLSPGLDRAARNWMNSMAGGIISLSLRSGLVHVARIRGTWQQTGVFNTMAGIGDFMADSVRYFFAEEGTHWARNLQESQVLDSRGNLQEVYNDITSAIIGKRPRDFLQAIKEGNRRDVGRYFDAKIGFAWMRLVDNIMAQVAYNAGRRLGERAGLKGNALRNLADDLVVRTEGGTMPGDVTAIQYTTGGKMLTQFHRYAINNFNFFIEDVLHNTGRKDIARLLNRDPDRFVPAVVKSMAAFVVATTALNTFFEDVLHSSAPHTQTPIRALKRGIDAGEGILSLAGTLAGSLATELPLIGPTAHGFGLGGALVGTLTEVGKQVFNAPGAYRSFKEGDTPAQAAMRLYGSPIVQLLGGRGSRAVGQIVKGMDRNDPLTSFYPRPLSETQQPKSGKLKGLERPSEGLIRLR